MQRDTATRRDSSLRPWKVKRQEHCPQGMPDGRLAETWHSVCFPGILNELATFLPHDIHCRMRFFSRIASGSCGNPEEYSPPVPVWPPWKVHPPSLWVCPPLALPAIPHSRSVRLWRRGRSLRGWPAALGPSRVPLSATRRTPPPQFSGFMRHPRQVAP